MLKKCCYYLYTNITSILFLIICFSKPDTFDCIINMADLEMQDLRGKNSELVKKIQHYKMTAAQRENEKLDLMKENSDLRLKLAMLRSSDTTQTRKLDVELQSASEQALTHLVQASTVVARMLEMFKTYIHDRQEMQSNALPRWSSLTNAPAAEKINRVPPLLIGGRHIQPVVSLSRTLQSSSSLPVVSRSPNQNNHSLSGRAVPMHMLQDVFIPLTRIDAERPINSVEMDVDANGVDDSNEDLASEDSSERNLDEPRIASDGEDFEETQRLEVVEEDIEPDDAVTPQRSRTEDPLEGPSWLLEESNATLNFNGFPNLEPDSTTELHESVPSVPTPRLSPNDAQVAESLAMRTFSPTVRRRKRNSPPPPTTPRSPRPARRDSNTGRILKVMVAKMRFDDDDSGQVPPPKRPTRAETTPTKPQKVFHRRGLDTSIGSPRRPTWELRFDAPSPNGSTDSRVIVLEANNDQPEPCCSGVPRSCTVGGTNSCDTATESPESATQPNGNHSTHAHSKPDDNNPSRPILNHNTCYQQNSRPNSRSGKNGRRHDSLSVNGAEGRDSDSSGSDVIGEGRTRRPRKAVTYKEKPLNRKLRR